MKFLLLNYEMESDSWYIHGKEGKKLLLNEEVRYFRMITHGQRMPSTWAIRYFILGIKVSLFKKIRLKLATWLIGSLNT